MWLSSINVRLRPLINVNESGDASLDACFWVISIKARLTSFNQKRLRCVNAILTKMWSKKGYTPEAVLWSVTNGYDLQSGIQSNSFSPVTFVIIPDVLVKHLITKLCLSSLYAMAYQTMLAGMMVSITGTIPHGLSKQVYGFGAIFFLRAVQDWTN